MAPMGGASEAPHKISRKESSLTPCCYIAFVNWYIYGSHAKNQGYEGPMSQEEQEEPHRNLQYQII